MKEIFKKVESNIDMLVEKHVAWSLPITTEELQRAREGVLELKLGISKPVPQSWISDINLCLAIGTDATNGVVVHSLVKLLTNLVCKYNREREFLPGFVCGIAVNGALVARTRGCEDVFVGSTANTDSTVNTALDVGTLSMHINKDDKLERVVSDFTERITDDTANVDTAVAGDFSTNKNPTLGRHYFTGNTRAGVEFYTCIEDAVCDNITELVGVSFADTFCGFEISH